MYSKKRERDEVMGREVGFILSRVGIIIGEFFVWERGDLIYILKR